MGVNHRDWRGRMWRRGAALLASVVAWGVSGAVFAQAAPRGTWTRRLGKARWSLRICGEQSSAYMALRPDGKGTLSPDVCHRWED